MKLLILSVIIIQLADIKCRSPAVAVNSMVGEGGRRRERGWAREMERERQRERESWERDRSVIKANK